MAAELSGLSIQETIRQGPVWDELRARQEPLGRPVRVLRLAKGLVPSSPLAHHLRRKAKTLSRLDHPAIVRLLDFRETAETIALVVEDVLDPSLADLWDKPFPVEACIALGLALSRALTHAHARGIVHGRLSPEAVRFTQEGRTKLEGFGSLLPQGDVEPIELEVRAGLAPETTIGQNPSPLSDLFCLGAILHQALSGVSPFGDSSEPGYAVRVRNDAPPPLIQSRPDAPLALRQLIEQCLEKRAAQRPSDAAQVAAVLEAMQSGNAEGALRRELAERGAIESAEGVGQPTLAPKPAVAYRPGRWEALVLGSVVGAFLTYGAVNAQDERSRDPSPVLSLATVRQAEHMQLRVVATPWAHVLIDGKHRETTPFAQAIPLSPGRHIVRLEHPSAPAEERMIEGQAGQAILLDVRMAVKKPIRSLAEQPEIPEDDSP